MTSPVPGSPAMINTSQRCVVDEQDERGEISLTLRSDHCSSLRDSSQSLTEVLASTDDCVATRQRRAATRRAEVNEQGTEKSCLSMWREGSAGERTSDSSM